jgi:hypothetical protein
MKAAFKSLTAFNKEAFKAYVNTGDPQAASALKERVDLYDQYQEFVLQLLSKWNNDQNFISSVRFKRNGGVAVYKDLDLKDKDLVYFPLLISTVIGDLDLSFTSIRKLDGLESVSGNISVFGSDVKSMQSLARVGGYVDLQRTSSLTELPSLEFVGNDLIAHRAASLESAPLLRYVGGKLRISRSALTKFESLEKVLGGIHMRWVNFDQFKEAFPVLQRVSMDRSGVAIRISDVKLYQEINQLVDAGKIKVEGEIFYEND